MQDQSSTMRSRPPGPNGHCCAAVVFATLWCCFFASYGMTKAEAITPGDVKQIYTNLLKAAGDGRTLPELSFVQKLGGPAEFCPATFPDCQSPRDRISVDDTFLKLAETFGPDAGKSVKGSGTLVFIKAR